MQRWFCYSCKHSFRARNTICKEIREQIWFKRWIIEGYSIRQLSLQCNHGRDKLYRIINHWLQKLPPEAKHSIESNQFLIFDGTFLHRPVSIITLMNANTYTIVSGKYGVRENSDRHLLDFFRPLIARGLNPKSFTVDGNPQVISTIKTLWPNILIQRCLVHIQRQGLMWCRHNPKTKYSQKLRDIFLRVTHIRTKAERDQLLESVSQWENKYGLYIQTHPERGRVFSDIKRARSMLLKALPDMFHYLDNPNIAFSTNGLEGYFSRLKRNYGQHRGLTQKKLNNYFAWYFYFKPK
jgi:hypothetical protein